MKSKLGIFHIGVGDMTKQEANAYATHVREKTNEIFNVHDWDVIYIPENGSDKCYFEIIENGK